MHGGAQASLFVGRPGFVGGFHGGFHDDFHRHFRTEVFVDFGPFWWGAPWWYAPSYYSPPVVVVEEPSVYIQQQPASATPDASWYYCPNARAYYPTVQTCPEAWVRVPGRATQ